MYFLPQSPAPPLISIRGFAQAIADGAAGAPGAVRKSAEVIRDEAERMVGELLDLTRIETGQILMQRVPTQVAGVLPSCVESQLLRAQAVGIGPTSRRDRDQLACISE